MRFFSVAPQSRSAATHTHSGYSLMNQKRKRNSSAAFDPSCTSDSSANSTSSMDSSSSSPLNSNSRIHQTPRTSGDCLVSDEELARISVRQLNQKLQGQNRDVVTQFKQKRRTLKNRGYALNCRVRRIQTQLQLEADNLMLRDQIRRLRQTLAELQHRLQFYEPAFHYEAYAPIPPNGVSGVSCGVPQTPYDPSLTNINPPNMCYDMSKVKRLDDQHIPYAL